MTLWLALLLAWCSGALMAAGVLLWRLSSRQATPAEVAPHAWHATKVGPGKW